MKEISMPRKLPMVALALFTASSFTLAQTTDSFFTRYIIRRRPPVSPTPAPTSTAPTTTDPAPTEPTTTPDPAPSTPIATTDPTPTAPATTEPPPTTPRTTTDPAPTSTPDPAPAAPSTTTDPAPTASIPSPQQLACSVMSLGQGAGLNGYLPFAANDAWRQNISGASVDGN